MRIKLHAFSMGLAVAISCASSPPALAQSVTDIYNHDNMYRSSGAHTYDRHVNISLDAVESRVTTGGLRCASKYSSLQEANSKISELLYQWEWAIDDNWVKYAAMGSTNICRYENRPNYGWVYVRGAGWYYGNATALVVKKVPTTVRAKGWIVLTSYPDIKGTCY